MILITELNISMKHDVTGFTKARGLSPNSEQLGTLKSLDLLVCMSKTSYIEVCRPNTLTSCSSLIYTDRLNMFKMN